MRLVSDDQPADAVEGILVNVQSREAKASLAGVTSELYAGHVRLAADQTIPSRRTRLSREQEDVRRLRMFCAPAFRRSTQFASSDCSSV